MNVGIVGLGKMGLLHTGILNTIPEVKITAITEKESLIANYVRGAMPNVSVYDDYQDMINSGKLDLVYITTPISSHFPIAHECIENKINFFIEKPLTKNLEESKILCEKLKNSDLIHSVGYNRRFIDTFARVKTLLDSKILGNIFEVKSSMYVSNIFSKTKGWRSKKEVSGGGVLLDFGSHLVDLLLWYFGSIKKVSGNIKSVYSGEVEDFAHMKMEFSNKILGELDVSWSVRGYRIPEITLEIKGSDGSIRVNEDYIKISLEKPKSGFSEAGTTIYKQELNQGVLVDLGGPDYTKEDLHMVDCVKNKRQSLVNVFEASKTQSVIESMYSAAKGGSQEVRYFV